MSQARVGRWGRNLAVRIPAEIAKTVGVVGGEKVQIDVEDGVIVIRPVPDWQQSDAQAAAEEILAEGEKHSLGDLTFRDLIDDGRRW